LNVLFQHFASFFAIIYVNITFFKSRCEQGRNLARAPEVFDSDVHDRKVEVDDQTDGERRRQDGQSFGERT
jgi:hypothetical protein